MAGHDQNPTIGQLPNRDIKYTYSSYQNVKDVQCSYNYHSRVCDFNIYYTDYHDVDEDQVSIFGQSGAWSWNEGAGIMTRNLSGNVTTAWDDVASKK